MFESNVDFEFDDAIFGDLPPGRSEAPKRTFENEFTSTETNKKQCLNKTQASSSCTTPFADENNENIDDKSKLPSSNLTQLSVPSNSSQDRSRLLSLLVNQLQSNISQSHNLHEFLPPKFKRQVSFNSPVKKVVHRKFPGPAGLLPEREDFKIDIKTPEETNTKETKQDNTCDIVLCSQMSVKVFHERPWEQMKKDFQPKNCNTVYLPDKYNVAWIKAKAKANKLINQRAPFLAAVIQSIECFKSKTANFTMILKDATGQINGTIVPDLYEEYIEVLKVGSVIVLKQFGVLTTDHGSNHNVTITGNNLVSIYSWRDNAGADVTYTPIQKLTVEDFIKNIAEVKSKHKTALLERKFNSNYEFCLNFSPACDNVISNYDKKETRRDTFASPIRNLSARTMSDTVSAKCVSTQEGSNISANFVSKNCAPISNASTDFNKECLNTPVNKSRFNFKSHVNNMNNNKPNEISSVVPSSSFDKSNVVVRTEPYSSAQSKEKDVLSQLQTVKCSQLSIKSDNVEHCAILQNVFEGVDADLLFEDF